MPVFEFKNILVPASMAWSLAVARMDAAAQGILLAVDDAGQLLRTVTDGDLRRAVLAQAPPLQALSELPYGAPVTAPESASAAQLQALLSAHSIAHIAIVNAAGEPVDMVSGRDLLERVWLSSPHLGEQESEFVAEAFRTNWIAPLGPHVDAFEAELASHVGMQHAAALSSGTAALHLGLLLLGVKPGDTVFCSSLTFVASCNPILYCQAQPVFIDSEPDTWNMSPAALEAAFAWAQSQGRMPACVILVNLYGQSADMDALLPICQRFGVPVLEDAAESLGAFYKRKSSGSFGHVTVFSFNGNKIITTSGGGMLLANDPVLVARARKLSTQARETAAHYEHTEVGFNYRMSNVLAGIGRGQLRVLKDRVAQRRLVFQRYVTALADMPQIDWMPEPEGYHSTHWLSCFTLKGPNAQAQCQQIMRSLERHLIEARPVWKPMHLQPLFAGAPFFPHAPGWDVSAGLFQTGICLPSGSNMSQAQQNRVIDHLRHALLMLEDGRAAA